SIFVTSLEVQLNTDYLRAITPCAVYGQLGQCTDLWQREQCSVVQFFKEDEYRDWVQKELEVRFAGTPYVVLKSMNVNDIIVCVQRSDAPIALFVEVKYFTTSKGRLGLGDGGGRGFQPEILTRRPTYFEQYLRWLIGSERNLAVLVSSTQLWRHAAGGVFKEGKQNNIQPSVLSCENQPFPIDQSPGRVAE
ncbi:MAG: hypothetical protein ACE5M4_15080, partial [Anaerolineales bacterium]